MIFKYIIRLILLLPLLYFADRTLFARTSSLTAAKGNFKDSIELSWNKLPIQEISVFRADKASGPFVKISTANGKYFVDRELEPGTKYWYRICDNTGTVLSSDTGFTRPAVPNGLMPEDILKTRTKGIPRPRDVIEKSRWDSHLSVMSDYYENYITVSIIIYIGKMYIAKGDLIAFRDFSNYSIDYPNKTIVAYKNGMQPVKFYSKRLFRFLKRCEKHNIPESEILPRLIANAIFFCVRRGNAEINTPDGRTRVAPLYEALGMSTEYFRDYRKWRSSTIVFGSDTRDLEALIEQNRKTRM